MINEREIRTAYQAGHAARESHETVESAVYDGTWDYTMDPVEQIAWAMGWDGRDLVEVTGWRLGAIPESGRSYNHMDDCWERGVSLMALDGDEMISAVASMAAADRPIVRVRGYLSGHGADGEPLVIGAIEIK